MEKISRSEHLAWCKERALEYVRRGDLINAYKSMCSDLNKHEETKDQSAIGLGILLLSMGKLETAEDMEKFINGFN